MTLTRSISVILRQLALECCSPQSSGMHTSSCTHAQMNAAEEHTPTLTRSRLFSLKGKLTQNRRIYLHFLTLCFTYIHVIRCDFYPQSSLQFSTLNGYFSFCVAFGAVLLAKKFIRTFIIIRECYSPAGINNKRR